MKRFLAAVALLFAAFTFGPGTSPPAGALRSTPSGCKVWSYDGHPYSQCGPGTVTTGSQQRVHASCGWPWGEVTGPWVYIYQNAISKGSACVFGSLQNIHIDFR